MKGTPWRKSSALGTPGRVIDAGLREMGLEPALKQRWAAWVASTEGI